MAEHDIRCERVYTESGFVFIDCMCSLRRAKAKAWDEGYEAAEFMARCWGHVDQWEDEPVNPYATPAASGTETEETGA